MASSLEQFLKVKVQEVPTETLEVIMQDGNKLEVDIKGLTYSELKKVKIESSFPFSSQVSGAQIVQAEELELAQRMCAAGIVEPSLNNTKLRAHFGNVHSREELVANMFPPKEIIRIGGAISNLTLGDDEDINVDNGVSEELLEEAKN